MTLTNFIFRKNPFKESTSIIKSYFKQKDTKVAFLISHWGAETVFQTATVVAFIILGNYPLALLTLAFIAYHTYAVFGIVSEVY